MKIGMVGLGDVGLPRRMPYFCVERIARALSGHAKSVRARASGSSACPTSPALATCATRVIVTAHPGLDLERVVRESPIVVDFRGVTRGIEASNLVRL